MLLVASFLQPPADHFEGYCFAGTDFISGHEGARAYEKARGRAVEPGNDGSYSVVTSRADSVEVGTDARGSVKLYLYRRAGVWAISTSLPLLVDLLRARGLNVKHRPAILFPLGLDLNFTHQQVTTQSMFEDISLVPSFEKVVIREEKVTLESAYGEGSENSYEESLSSYVSIWKARLRLLLSDPRTSLSADLTGGQDSRVCFAFAHSTGLLSTTSANARLASNVGQLKDFEIADSIAQKYGYSLNTQIERPRARPSGERGFNRWREKSMGTYLPVYLKALEREPLRLHLHGAGGGNFRPVYGSGNLHQKLEQYKERMPPKLYDEFRGTALEDMLYLARMRPGVRELSLHYREFRNRFHFGFFPQCETLISPLNSVLLDSVTDRPGVDADNVYADVMDSLVPGLKGMPYDSPRKDLPGTAPSAAAEAARSRSAPAGRIFSSDDSELPYASGGRPLWNWLDYSERALHSIRGSGHLSDDEWREARLGLETMRGSGKMSAPNSRPVKLLSFASAVQLAIE